MEFWQLLVGTLSGFVIAFMAEPVKLYFENKHKKDAIKTAIYSEICSNYRVIAITMDPTKGFVHEDIHEIFRTNLSTACYDYTIKNDPILFYQLDEYDQINVIYGNIKPLMLDINYPSVEFRKIHALDVRDSVGFALEILVTTEKNPRRIKLLRRTTKVHSRPEHEIMNDYDQVFKRVADNANLLTDLLSKP